MIKDFHFINLNIFFDISHFKIVIAQICFLCVFLEDKFTNEYNGDCAKFTNRIKEKIMKKIIYILLAVSIPFTSIILLNEPLQAKEINQSFVDINSTVESIDDSLQNVIKNGEADEQGNVSHVEHPMTASAFQAMADEGYLIPDLQLRKIVNAKLGKSGGALETYEATESELATIKNDWASFDILSTKSSDMLDIKSLEGLQYLTGVKQLRLQNIIMQEKDLAVISQMTWLEGLRFNSVIFGGETSATTPRYNISINGGAVQGIVHIPIDQEIDLSPLGNLSNLKTFYFTLNGMQQDGAYTYSRRTYYDLSGLDGLINVKELELNDMGAVADTTYDFLRSLQKLERLSIIDTPLDDVTSISTLENLKFLNIYGTSVRDFRPIIDKSYFTGASGLKYNFDVQYYDKIEQNGVEMNGFNLDTGIITGSEITNLGFTTVSSHLGTFDIHDATNDGSLKLNFELKDMKSYSLLNYVTGLYDIKKLGFVFGANITTENGKTISYSINTITLGKKVTFNSNYTGGTIKEVTFDPFEKIIRPTDITRDGQKIVDWYKDQQGTEIFDFDSDQNTNITLYAQWELENYNLSFDLNGGSGTQPDNQTIKYGEKAETVASPVKIGYVFKEWNSEQNGMGYTWNFDTTTMPGNDVTLYAQWEANEYEVSFDANGGEGTMSNEAYNYAETKPLLKNEYTRLGYTFIGWSETATGDVVYEDETNYDFQKTKDMTLYAQWEKNSNEDNTYILKFDLNGAVGTPPSSQSILSGSFAMKPENPKRAGYEFSNWNTARDGSGIEWEFGIERVAINQKNNNFATPMPAKEITLYAQWIAIEDETTTTENETTAVITDEKLENTLPTTGLSNMVSIFGGIALSVGSGLLILKRKLTK